MSLIPQALLCFILLFVTWWWWKINKSSTLIINWPIVGMMPGHFYNVNRLHEFLTDLLKQNGGTFVFKGPWIARLDMVFISNADNVHYMLSKNFGNYSKGPDYKEVFEPLGNGILVASGKNWKLQRRVIHAVFRDNRFELARERATKQKILHGLFLLLDQASELGSQLDIQDLLRRFMFDTVCQIVLDFDPNTLSLGLPELDYAKAFKVIQEVTFYRNVLPTVIWKVQRWLQVGQEKQLRKACKIFDNFIYSCITRKREQLARDGSSAANLQEQFNLLSYFMVEYNEDNNNNNNDDDDENDELSRAYTKSDKFLRDTACNLVAAGRDSVAAGFAWFLYLVATHPSVEEKILQEMRDVLGKKVQNGENLIPEKEELNKLTYLQASILETLRLYPTVPFDLIFSTGSDTLPSGHQISANTKVVYMLYSMGRMEQIWGKDCSEFKPERWIEFPQGKIKHVPSYKFIAFNTGPRTCLGKELALEQMKTVASALLWNYRFQVVEGHPVYPANSVILHIKHGLQIRIFKRNV